MSTDAWFVEKADETRELERKHANRRIIEFALFARELPSYAHVAVESAARMTLFYQTAKRLSPDILAGMATEPQFHYWTVHALHLLRRLQANEVVPASDTPHLDSVLFFQRDPLGVHVKDFARFLLVAALRSGQEFEATVPLHNGTLHLPGLNMMIRVEGSTPEVVVAVNAGLHAMTVNGHAVQDFEKAMAVALAQNAGFANQQVLVFPFVRRIAGAIAVNAVEPYWERTWVSSYRNPDGSSYQNIPIGDHAIRAIELAKAMDVLADCWPQMEADIASLLRVIVPVRCPHPDVHMSCSSDVFRLAVLLSQGDSEMLAEALVHELGHNLLNILIEDGALFDPRPPREEILYSPWRLDARPLSGVLHAAFVFERVCEYYRRYLERKQNQRIRERYALMAARVCLANEVLADCGANLVAGGVHLLKQIQERMEHHTEVSAFLHDEPTSIKLRKHYQAWIERNPSGRRPVGKYVSQLLGP